MGAICWPKRSKEPARAGISPGAWVTIFANGLIAKTHTPWAVQNLYQSADRLFLCFNNPEVREYSLRVCSEVAERYERDGDHARQNSAAVPGDRCIRWHQDRPSATHAGLDLLLLALRGGGEEIRPRLGGVSPEILGARCKMLGDSTPCRLLATRRLNRRHRDSVVAAG